MMRVTAGVDAVLPKERTGPTLEVRGKFIFRDGKKHYLRGMTYGTFRPDAEGNLFPDPALAARDFEVMRASGVNAVRTYTVPPGWLLDLAHDNGLALMIGIPWEQHVTFLDKREVGKHIEETVRDAVCRCAGHPAVLAFLIGNEIPAPIVRWYGRRRIENWLRRLYRVAKRENATALVSYVNYPTTEYLDLSFLDFICFNVYLESRESLRDYLARLQNIAGEKPLVMTEIGLDSRRNGLEKQAEVLDWQVREVFAEGCGGAFVFAWTDEWYRGGYDILDWDFGVTTRDRQPKPALEAVERSFAAVPFSTDTPWPRSSVVICSYNGSRTIRDTFEALQRLEYPDFEVILVDDGSVDDTPTIGKAYGVRVITTENRGLSNARNTGFEAATGEIVAYIDDDAYPDPHWLHYLAHRFLQGGWAGVGGPNLAAPGDGMIAECVANAPGGPVHVLISDREAEHIPGCNMAFRRDALLAAGGFDPQYRVAGDDVDLCWRLMGTGWTIGFHASGMVWHHRRNSVRTYWKQQRGYGRAEALLERKWPEKYNALGHLSWTGRLYGRGLTAALSRAAGRLYQGHGGTAQFQSVYEPASGLLSGLLLMPEWYFAVASLALLSALGALWTPLLAALPFFTLALLAPATQAVISGTRATFPGRRDGALRLRALTALLHLLQPIARLRGRLEYGLAPWRRRGRGVAVPLPVRWSVWREEWQSPEARAQTVADSLKRQEAAWSPGGDFDPWDFEVRGGLLSSARLLSTVEEHGGGRQMVRFRSWPRLSAFALTMMGMFGALALAAVIAGAWLAAGALGLIALITVVRAIWEGALAMGTVRSAIAEHPGASE